MAAFQTQEGNKCYWGFTHRDKSSKFIVGEVFFQTLYTVFDNEKN